MSVSDTAPQEACQDRGEEQGRNLWNVRSLLSADPRVRHGALPEVVLCLPCAEEGGSLRAKPDEGASPGHKGKPQCHGAQFSLSRAGFSCQRSDDAFNL
jgi:hypothetical protein